MKYVAKAEPGVGWRVWNRKMKKTWGNYFHYYPEDLLKELNGLKRPDILIALCKESFTKK